MYCSQGNSIRKEGAKALANALKVNSTLQSLDLEGMALCILAGSGYFGYCFGYSILSD